MDPLPTRPIGLHTAWSHQLTNLLPLHQTTNNAYKEKLAEYLLQIKAIQLDTQNPFTWASGWKSPVYCDNRKLLSYPEIRNFVKEGLVSLVKEYFPLTDCIAGVATAGIPHGAILADALGLPFVYVRSKPKEHGLTNTIEGDLKHGLRVLVVEDTISGVVRAWMCHHRRKFVRPG